MEKIAKAKRVSKLTKLERKTLDERVKKYLKGHKNTFYLAEDLKAELGLQFIQGSFAAYLKHNFEKMKLLLIHVNKPRSPGYDSYYGVSDYCEPGECFYDWCQDVNKCRIHQPNPKLHFYKRENRKLFK